MPKHLRDKARLMAMSMQGWFDESGKEGWPREKTSPVFLLAGYVATVRVWAKFADAWQGELDRRPKLNALHTKDAYGFENEFGEGSAWVKRWGRRNEIERDKRLLRFAQLIEDHMATIWNAYGVPDRLCLTWMVSHDEYADFKRMMANHPQATPSELKTIKHPYYLSFQYILGACIKYKNVTRTPDESLQVLFDCGMDNPKRLRMAFDKWIEVVKLNDASLLKQLVNHQAEFRDDEKHPELQAADFLAYHLRKFVYEVTQMNNRAYAENPIWRTLRSNRIEALHLRYEARQWRKLAGQVLRPFSPLVPVPARIRPHAMGRY
jgi:hypothetical protein